MTASVHVIPNRYSAIPCVSCSSCKHADSHSWTAHSKRPETWVNDLCIVGDDVAVSFKRKWQDVPQIWLDPSARRSSRPKTDARILLY
jgi:hypothetical protein